VKGCVGALWAYSRKLQSWKNATCNAKKSKWKAQGCYPSSPVHDADLTKVLLQFVFRHIFFALGSPERSPGGAPNNIQEGSISNQFETPRIGVNQWTTCHNQKPQNAWVKLLGSYWARSAMDLSSRELHHAADSHF
jgi:hypothetical protein